LGGSDGGLWESNAALLAAHGYAVLSLAYFNYDNLPPKLTEIRLEYFEEGLTWLQKQECVAADRLAVIGVSRGAELALLLGSRFPKIKAVVAYAPAHVVALALSFPLTSAWSYQGKPIPFFLAKVDEAERRKVIAANPGAQTPHWHLMLKDKEAAKAAVILVEKINGPVLLISGKDDRSWPSAEMSEEIVKRLNEHNRTHRDVNLPYDDAGHFIGIPNGPIGETRVQHPRSKEWIEFGGTPQGNAFASWDSWAKMLRFLDETLKNK
jgi:dienelactone hydrolase